MLGEQPDYLWDEAVLRYLEETTHKRDHEGDKGRLRWLHQHLAGKSLNSITRESIDQIMRNKSHRAAGTINRYLATVRAILRKAEREWCWITKAPTLNMRREPDKRVRWITPTEAVALMKALPTHLADMMDFALATGLRSKNVRQLRWDQIDMTRKVAWFYSDEMKGKRDLVVPLNATAINVIRRRLGKHKTHVFSYHGKALKGINSDTWAKALKKAGIENFRFHDLRHTWASWHVQSGTSLQELMELGGWRTYKMVLRYAHLAGDHLRGASQNIATIWLRFENDEATVKGVQ
jgi:integrase